MSYRIYYRDKITSTIECIEFERERECDKIFKYLDETGKSFLYATKINDWGIDTKPIELHNNDMIQRRELYANNQWDSWTTDNNS